MDFKILQKLRIAKTNKTNKTGTPGLRCIYRTLDIATTHYFLDIQTQT